MEDIGKMIGDRRWFRERGQIFKEMAPDMTAQMNDYAFMIDEIITDFGLKGGYALSEEDGHTTMIFNVNDCTKPCDKYQTSQDGDWLSVQLDSISKECGSAGVGGGYSQARYSDKTEKSDLTPDDDLYRDIKSSGNLVREIDNGDGTRTELYGWQSEYESGYSPCIYRFVLIGDSMVDGEIYVTPRAVRDACDQFSLAYPFLLKSKKSKVKKSTDALLHLKPLGQWYHMTSDGYPDYVTEEFAIRMEDYGDTPQDNADYLADYCERVYDGSRWIGNVDHYYIVEDNDIKEISRDDAKALAKSKTNKNGR